MVDISMNVSIQKQYFICIIRCSYALINIAILIAVITLAMPSSVLCTLAIICCPLQIGLQYIFYIAITALTTPYIIDPCTFHRYNTILHIHLTCTQH